MSDRIQNQYFPDYVSPPGETLFETLGALGMSQGELAERTGRPKKTINEIIKGKTAITPETALQLERVLGIPASFWNNRESNYRETLACLKEYDQLQGELGWLEKFPIKAMAEIGWVRSFQDKVQQLREVLNFLGVASPEQLRNLWCGQHLVFRKSPAFEIDRGALIAWLRKGEIEAQRIHCDSYDSKKFLKVLRQVRSLTMESPETFESKVVLLCAKAGVAVTFVPELPKIRVSGVTRWLSPHKALIQLSLRYKTDDQLWFTFFHEAGHIIRHGKRTIFIEHEFNKSEDTKEKEADNFATNILIPPTKFLKFIGYGDRSERAIVRFAAEIGIAPSIVVGRLQHEGILQYSHCNDLKRRLRWNLN
jgi:addiction module HigA family antidote